MTPEERAHRICMEWYESEHMELEQLRVAIVDAQREASKEALEEAARFVEENYEEPMINIVGNPSWRERGPKNLAAAIRALKDEGE